WVMSLSPMVIQQLGYYWQTLFAGVAPFAVGALLGSLMVWFLVPRLELVGMVGRAQWFLGWLRIAVAIAFALGVLWPAAKAAEFVCFVILTGLPTRYFDAINWVKAFCPIVVCPVALLVWRMAPWLARGAMLSARPKSTLLLRMGAILLVGGA